VCGGVLPVEDDKGIAVLDPRLSHDRLPHQARKNRLIDDELPYRDIMMRYYHIGTS